MSSIQEATDEGVNGFLQKQLEQKTDEMTVTLAQFDDEYQVVYAHTPIQDAPKFRLVPRGMTALLDAVGRTVDETGAYLGSLPEAERPARVMMVIMTDGQENASRRYTLADINRRIRHQTDVYSWSFVYLGANQDAISVGQSLGVPVNYSATYAATNSGVTNTMNVMNSKVAAYRSFDSTDSTFSAFTDAERDALNSK